MGKIGWYAQIHLTSELKMDRPPLIEDFFRRLPRPEKPGPYTRGLDWKSSPSTGRPCRAGPKADGTAPEGF